jgi:hypothetical protein
MGKNIKHSGGVRRHKGVRVKRKQEKRHKYLKGKKSMNTRVQGIWDNELTLKQNYERMGLQGDLNEAINKYSTVPMPKSQYHYDNKHEKSETEWGEQPKEVPRREEYVMSEEEQLYVSKLQAAHGDNFRKMQMDYKANPMMWTASKCRRRIARYRMLAVKITAEADPE